jgi:hypothetical protein
MSLTFEHREAYKLRVLVEAIGEKIMVMSLVFGGRDSARAYPDRDKFPG